MVNETAEVEQITTVIYTIFTVTAVFIFFAIIGFIAVDVVPTPNRVI